jgi:hypothetical protein
MARTVDQPTKESYLTVIFQYGDLANPTYQGYTDWAQAVVGQVPLVVTPEMSVKVPANNGDFSKRKATIVLPSDAFTDELSSIVQSSRTYVTVVEITRSLTPGAVASVLTPFRGLCLKAIRNYQGKPNAIAVEALPFKSRLDVKMGLPCEQHCVWTLFGIGCERAFQSQPGVISGISGKILTTVTPGITSPTSPGGTVDRFWERGYVIKDGVVVDIHRWDIADPTKIVLRRTPPASWLSTTVTFVAGCHKTVEDCGDVWANVQGQAGRGGFAGLGYAIPPYHPQFENPN